MLLEDWNFIFFPKEIEQVEKYWQNISVKTYLDNIVVLAILVRINVCMYVK